MIRRPEAITAVVFIFSADLRAETNCAKVAPNLASLITESANSKKYDSLKVVEVDGSDVKILNDGKVPAAYSRALSPFSSQEIQGRAPRDCVTEVTVTANENSEQRQGRCLVGLVENPQHQIFFAISECENFTPNLGFATWLHSINKLPERT